MTLFGPDGARYQEGIKVTDADWAAVDFGIWRAIHQSGGLDRTYPVMRDQFRLHDKPFAAYVWVDAMDPERKADYAATAIRDSTIPVMVDWEDARCSWGRALAFVSAMRERGYKVPLLYTGRAFHQSMGSPRLTGYDLELVVARYGDQNGAGIYECEPRYQAMLPRFGVWSWNLGGLTPVMWQFGSRIRWGDRYMDMNAVLDPAVINRCFRLWSAPAPTPGPVPIPVPIPDDPMEDDDVISADELDSIWDAPSVADVADHENRSAQRWYNAMILKVGPPAEVQRRNKLKVNGRYNQATATAYDNELAAMRAAGL